MPVAPRPLASTVAPPPLVCALRRSSDVVLERALVAQERAPDETAPISRSLVTRARWLWILDGSAVPRPSALARLVEAADRLQDLVRPIVLASRVLDSGGRLAPGHVPLAPQDQTAVAIRTASARVLHVRAVSSGSLLVRREAVTEAPPIGVAATMSWTARLLARGGGFLVPDSVADVVSDGGAGGERVRVAARLVLGRGLHRRERLRLGVELLERATAH